MLNLCFSPDGNNIPSTAVLISLSRSKIVIFILFIINLYFQAVIVLGLIIMVLGTYANLQAAENQIDRYDDKYITKERIDKMVEDFFQKQEKSDGK